MAQHRIVIRPLRLTDVADIHDVMHMPAVLWNASLLPSTPAETWREIIEQWLHDEHAHVFVAEMQGKVVGTVRVHTGQGRAHHVGDIILAVHDKYQGQGIGKMLLLTIIDLADNWLNLLRLELDVYTDNERALRLLKNFDFEIEGRMRASGYRNGKYIDSYRMARLRSQIPNWYPDSIAQPSSAQTSAGVSESQE